MINQRNVIKLAIIASIFILFFVAYQRSSTTNYESGFEYRNRVLGAVSLVDIDSSGKFKYILVKVYDPEHTHSKIVVRGHKKFKYHAEICDDIRLTLESLGLSIDCLSGGRIEHYPDLKSIKVYGYSKTFGMADHNQTRSILLTKYPNYLIETSNLGY